MRFLLWQINRNDKVFAKISWILYRLFGIKRTMPCGRTKRTSYLCCDLPPNPKNSYIINDDITHEVRCKVCDSVHMMSSNHISEITECYW
jgi:hypothetical protein